MMLADEAIRSAWKAGRLKIEPWDEACLQPASYELRLAPSLVYWDEAGSSRVKGFEAYTLLPGRFVLTATTARIGLPYDVAARVEGKSSLGRQGLLIHATAGWIDPGFEGEITLEFKHLGNEPIGLKAGMKIAQLCFFQTTGAARPYGHEALGSKYQGQVGPTKARG